MARILLIDTSTSDFSVAISEDGAVARSLRSDTPRSQAAMLAPMVKELMDGASLRATDLDAVCISKGPGSYTGLRVGTSTAKGICFGAGIPLLGIGTLDLLAAQAVREGLVPEGCSHVIPMVDARRMEVFSAVFSAGGVRESVTEATVIGPDSFADLRAGGGVLLLTGDGAAKCADVLRGDDICIAPLSPDASAMAPAAEAAYNEKRLEDIAYFEPFYLKDFVATVGKKLL